MHAVGQVAAVTLPSWGATALDLQRALNARLPVDLGATDVAPCAESFNPRFDAVWREYRYWIASAVVSPFLGRYAWIRRTELDAEAVRAGAQRARGDARLRVIRGRRRGRSVVAASSKTEGVPRGRSFAAIAGRSSLRIGPGSDELARVLEVRVVGGRILAAHGAQYRRSIASRSGRAGETPEWIDELLAERDRRFGPVTAPPQGLTLMRVGFDGDQLDDD